MVEPSTQWFGSGLGHSGSTSKCGAIMPVDCAATVLSSTACPMPSAARSETNPAPIKRFFLEPVSLFRVLMFPSASYVLLGAVLLEVASRGAIRAGATIAISWLSYESGASLLGGDFAVALQAAYEREA